MGFSVDFTPDDNDSNNLIGGGKNNKVPGGLLGGFIGGVGRGLSGDPIGGWGQMFGQELGMNYGLQGLLGGAGGLFGGSSAPKGGDNGAGMAQAQAGLAAALAQADAAKYAADKQFELGQMGIDAQMQASRNSMMGGLVTAAMAANQDTTVRKQLMPHEAGAATIASHDLAQRWQKTLEMRTAGYQDAAINYELQGRSWKAAFDDPTWNSLRMREKIKGDTLQNVQLFGIKSPGNPAGVEMSEDDWINMHAMKPADDVLKVDPNEAALRNAQYAKWKQDMYAKGQGMVVDLYENPQLAGSSILTMKGKDPLIDPRLKGLLQNMGEQGGAAHSNANMDKELAALKKPEWRHLESNSPGMGQYFDANGNMITDTSQGGRVISAKDQYNAQMDKYYKERDVIMKRYSSLQAEDRKMKTNWDQAINALTQGEKNPMTDQIKKLMDAGVIDKYGMVYADKLSQFIPPELTKAPMFSLHNPISPEQEMKLKDEYKKYADMKIDEKLVRVEQMGGGVTRKMLLNPDGTRAATMMTGYMTDGMGNQVMASVTGSRTQDFYDVASRVNGLSYSHMSAGYRAPVDRNLMGGATVKRDNWNYMATAATGQKGQAPAQKAGTSTINSNTQPDPLAKKGGASLMPGDD